MKEMFSQCTSLKSLNIYNFDTSNVTQHSNLFYNISNNIIFCSNQEKQSNIVYLFSSFNNNCSFFCISDNKKYIFETNECLYKCNESNLYKYEYNNFNIAQMFHIFQIQMNFCVKVILYIQHIIHIQI